MYVSLKQLFVINLTLKASKEINNSQFKMIYTTILKSPCILSRTIPSLIRLVFQSLMNVDMGITVYVIVPTLV